MKWKLFIVLSILSTTCIYAQDILVKKSGDSLKVKILEVGLSEIKYKNFDDLDGITYGIFKSSVVCIRYKNGRVEYFDEKEELSAEKLCYCGHTDAARYHGKKGTHFVLGVLFGPFAMLGTAASKPTPRKGRRTYKLSQNSHLFSDLTYLKCYRKKAKSDLIGMEALGWGAWMLFVFTNQ